MIINWIFWAIPQEYIRRYFLYLALILFFIPASLIIIGALIVVFAKNPVHNAMGLVMTLVSIAIIYITLNATFVAMVQMLVYAGAVMLSLIHI